MTLSQTTLQQVQAILQNLAQQQAQDGPLPFFHITRHADYHIRLQWQPKKDPRFGYQASVFLYRCQHCCYEPRGSGRCCRCERRQRPRIDRPLCRICASYGEPRQERLDGIL